ncbi:MAG: PepSY domain-containing protein [Parasporobacterium sp.]|nr:PepSY domain-containing protein [Parasporobacterium sp.]
MKKTAITTIALLALSVLVSTTAFAAETPAEKEIPDSVSAAVPERPAVTAKLSEQEALAAALKDAGVSQAAITVTRTQLAEKQTDTGETIPVYTVKFSSDTTSYKYYIDANSGSVLYKNIEYSGKEFTLKERSHDRETTEKSDSDSSKNYEKSDSDSPKGSEKAGSHSVKGKGASGSNSSTAESNTIASGSGRDILN